MCEEESDSNSQQDLNNHGTLKTAYERERNSNCASSTHYSSELSRELAAIPMTIVYGLAPSQEASAIARCRGLEEQCCCDSKIYYYFARTNSASDSALSTRQAFCGWKHRTIPRKVRSSTSSHIVIEQTKSDQSLASSKSSASSKSTKNSFYPANLQSSNASYCKRINSSKSLVRSYIHGEYSKAIQYDFEHHIGNNASLHIDKYRKTVTYPKLEQKSMGGAGAPEVEMTLWSGRCVQSSVVIKPKLFVLGKPPDAFHTRPFVCRKSYPHGQSLYSVAESRVNSTKFRLSNIPTGPPTAHQPSHTYTGSNQFSLPDLEQPHSQQVDHISKSDSRQYPVSVVGGFSSQSAEASLNQCTEREFVGAEEDGDAQLSMTWISQPVPESFLVSSVTYMSPSSKARQRAISVPIRNANLGFKGAVNVNSLRSSNRSGPGTSLLSMNGQRPVSGRTHMGTEKLTYSMHLSTQSMPLIKSEKAQSAKNNKLGHLLKRREKSVWRNHSDDQTSSLISAEGIY